MLQKTRGIVLHQIKYSDSGIVVQVYTRTNGRVALLVKGLRTKKTGKHNVLFQPLSILDLEIYYSDKRSVQVLREFSSAWPVTGILSDVKKSSIAIFLGEVLNSVLKEESPYPGLFDFIENSLIWFDRTGEGFSNFHIAFLTGMSRYLGFGPQGKTDPANRYFDLLNGIFVPLPPVHGNYADEKISEILSLFFTTSYDSMKEIGLSGPLRNEILDTLIRFYSIHHPGVARINSLGVLREIFG